MVSTLFVPLRPLTGYELAHCRTEACAFVARLKRGTRHLDDAELAALAAEADRKTVKRRARVVEALQIKRDQDMEKMRATWLSER